MTHPRRPMNINRVILLVGVPLLCVTTALFTVVMRSVMGIGAGYIQGMLVDNNNGQPLQGVAVAVSNRGWGVVNGQLVWDKDYVYQDITDGNGRFRVVFRVGSTAHVIVRQEGYQSYDAWHDRNSTITIRLQRTISDYRPLPHGILEIGMRDSQPYGWIFMEQRTTTNRREADIFPELTGPRIEPGRAFRLQVLGGIMFVTSEALSAGGDPLVYANVAPEQGYVTEVWFDLYQEGGIYFVRTRDGAYAKFVSLSMTTGSEADIRQGNWSVHFEYVHNPDGSRNLAFQR